MCFNTKILLLYSETEPPGIKAEGGRKRADAHQMAFLHHEPKGKNAVIPFSLSLPVSIPACPAPF
ncbi:hypothetical protein CXP47_29825 [Pseudomonas chlororaphis]|nr:hypothetical protein CXP47_29825 [Pseudomonas chlororaphis]KAB0523823.1 hypothetical protein F7R16_30030 [Pseudomonas chlororaphis subsp. aureofaciens]POA73430.1 hypothetical protein C1888_07515 [Pseudomonas sp. GW531-T4]TSD29751.1 hypothetical protein FCE86_009280 [Pseudomonas sp. ATCC 13985]KAA5830977.1 hypothetical protein F2A37_29720 [Pseudomonas chlororaphis]